MQQEKQAHALEAFLQRFHDETSEESRDEPEETYHVYPVPGGMVFLKEDPEEQVIDAAIPPNTKPPSRLFTAATVLFALLLPLSAILFQLYLACNPPVATVTIFPRVHTVTLTGSLQLGRIVHPITLSQSQTLPTTGKGHQDAKQAQGFITFYNGELNTITVPAGTVVTGTGGIPIATDQDAVIPAADPTANPPVFGRVTIAAHALHAGSAGNIPAYALNQVCCSTSIIAKNLSSFTGGADERTFQTAAKSDIDTTAQTLKATIIQSMHGALQGQLKPPEQLHILPCTPIGTADHQPGQEATQVKVTVTETCGAVAYNNTALITKAIALLSHQARQQLGTGYRHFGQAHITNIQATVSHTIATLIFSCQGTWVYALSQEWQQHSKQLIAGKPRQAAVQILASLPGIEHASIAWDAQTKLPKNLDNIHFHLFIHNS